MENYEHKTHPSDARARDDKIFANYSPLVLKPNVISWLMNLSEDSISCWADLCNKFVGTFTGSHKVPGQESDL